MPCGCFFAGTMGDMLNRTCFLVMIVCAVSTAVHSSHAQIIYEPIQYQYGDQNQFYYGGMDPRVFQRAGAPSDPGSDWGRANGNDFASGDVWEHREVTGQPARVYSDALPTQNGTLYGFTATDAANVANASMPRYFKKADVIAAAAKTSGLLIVPAQAIFPPAPIPRVRPEPTTRPLAILPVPDPAPIRPPPSDKLVIASH